MSKSREAAATDRQRGDLTALTGSRASGPDLSSAQSRTVVAAAASGETAGVAKLRALAESAKDGGYLMVPAAPILALLDERERLREVAGMVRVMVEGGGPDDSEHDLAVWQDFCAALGHEIVLTDDEERRPEPTEPEALQAFAARYGIPLPEGLHIDSNLVGPRRKLNPSR